MHVHCTSPILLENSSLHKDTELLSWQGAFSCSLEFRLITLQADNTKYVNTKDPWLRFVVFRHPFLLF